MQNTLEQKKEIFDLTREEFCALFEKKIKPRMKSEYLHFLSAKRILTFFISALIFMVTLFSTIVLFIGYPIFGFLSLIIFIISFRIMSRSSRTAQNVIKQLFFKTIGFDYFDGKTYISEYISVIESIAHKFSNLLFRVDDIIFGKYREYNFTFFDCIEGKSSHKIFFAMKAGKNFSSQTFITSDKNAGNIFFKGEQVNLEDIEFSKMFYTFSQDQVGARYLLTPSFMTRLLSYTKSNNTEIEILFSNKYSKMYNVFFYLPAPNNLFEFYHNWKRKDEFGCVTYYDFLSEIKKLIDIVDALKLDQDIGM